MKLKSRSWLRVLGWVIGIFLLLWLLIWGYVFLNKKEIIARVNTELNRRIKGEIKVGDLEPSLISTFPHVSLRLSHVFVRDTMWRTHRRDLLNAEHVFIRLGLLSLFTGTPEIRKVIVEKGTFTLFADSTGYSNEYIFSSTGQEGGGTGPKTTPPNIELKDVRLILDLEDRSKLYDFEVHRFKCDVKSRGDLLELNVKTAMQVHSLAFNKDNGSFIKEKPLEGKFRLSFNRVRKKLEFKNVALRVDGHPFLFSGMFDLAGVPPLYQLTIRTNKLDYKKASALLSENISSKLNRFNVIGPLEVITTIDGSTRPNRIPLVNIDVQAKDSRVSTPIGEFYEASFRGHFENQLSKSEKRIDNNSGFRFTAFSGKWESISLTADTVLITNLDHPILDCHITSSFDLSAVNDLLGTSTLLFTQGNCEADVRYRGLIIEGDTAGASIDGKVRLSNADLVYTPRNLRFSDCSGDIIFDDKDVYVRELKTKAGSSQLLMNGNVRNLTSLIDKSPEKLLLTWKIASSKLNLGDFLTFLGKRTNAASTGSSKRKFLRLANQLDRMLKDCNVDLQLKAERLTYKKFDASRVAANLQLSDRLVALKDVQIQHAGGTLSLNGSLRETGVDNAIALNAVMNNLDVAKVFTAFNNFGQDGIMDKNLGGRLSAKINLAGYLTDKATIVENSLKGIIDLSLKDGVLKDFEPVEKISETAFKNRDFSNIRFAELKERLEVNGSEFKVNRMEIQSSVLTMFVEGIYDVKKGTDLSIQIPLNNLSKKEKDYTLRNKGVNSKTGVSIRLRARTGEDGKAKISWDPFKLALKKKNRNKPDSTGTATPSVLPGEKKDPVKSSAGDER